MKKNKYIKKVMSFIMKFLESLKQKNKLIEESKVIEEDKVVNDKVSSGIIRLDRNILDERTLKGIDKIYLIILIANYNNKLGYVEISNKEILSAVNGTNINTVIKIINRLIEKKFIRKLVVENGHKNRYQILKYLEYSTDRIEDGSRCSKADDQHYLLDENDILLNKDLIKEILIENQIIKEMANDIFKRTEKSYDTLSEYVEL